MSELELNEFEKAADMADSMEARKMGLDENSVLENENVIEFIRNASVATVVFSQGRYVSRIRRLAKEDPENFKICHDGGSYVVAHIPVKAIKIYLPKRREMTEEEREAARERFEKNRRSRAPKADEDAWLEDEPDEDESYEEGENGDPGYDE